MRPSRNRSTPQLSIGSLSEKTLEALTVASGAMSPSTGSFKRVDVMVG